MTPREFEAWVADVFETARRGLDEFKVTLSDRVEGVDGEYALDATVRFDWAGVSFVIVAEAKLHRSPVKRELVQVLHEKVQSVGAHKGVMFSTSGFQRGAVEFAKVHGIALVAVTEGRFTIEMKSLEKPPPPSREVASQWGVPVFVGRCYSPGETADSIRSTSIDTRSPEYVRSLLLGLPE
jgi:hypothetical protein